MPRVPDTAVGQRLIDAAAELLAEHGPDALSTRRVAAQADTSSMAVYTHFGSIGGLVDAVVQNAFNRLAADLAEVGESEDPVGDLVGLMAATARFARRQPALYQVMFGAVALGEYRRTSPAALRTGRDETFGLIVAACRRATEAGRLAPGDAFLVAHQMWGVAHGYVMLEVAGFVRPPASERKVLRPMLETVLVGLGDSRDAALASIAARMGDA